jgi:hypothetical protein
VGANLGPRSVCIPTLDSLGLLVHYGHNDEP